MARRGLTGSEAQPPPLSLLLWRYGAALFPRVVPPSVLALVLGMSKRGATATSYKNRELSDGSNDSAPLVVAEIEQWRAVE